MARKKTIRQQVPRGRGAETGTAAAHGGSGRSWSLCSSAWKQWVQPALALALWHVASIHQPSVVSALEMSQHAQPFITMIYGDNTVEVV